MLSPNQGDFVWVDIGAHVPIGAEVKVTDTGQFQLIDDEGKVQNLSTVFFVVVMFRTGVCSHLHMYQLFYNVHTGAQDQQEDGGRHPAHAPHLCEGCGRHDTAR